MSIIEMYQIGNLPTPDDFSVQRSQELVKLIRQQIDIQGSLSFAQYMQQVLYAPGLGYYSGGLRKFGSEGDFVTAPEISPLFAKSLTQQILQVFEGLPGSSILEFGAGSGKLALDILKELETLNQLPAYYYILELSAELQKRQYAQFKTEIPHLLDRVVWLNELSDLHLQGVIIANEVLDAMPVHKFKWQSGFKEFYVDWQQDKWVCQLRPASAELQHYMDSLGICFSENYESEANLWLKPWIASLNQILDCGLVLLIDYGFSREEYYHPQRHAGTLMCHYRHYAHEDPLVLPGLQDITAHVDFTTVGEQALKNGFSVGGYTTQANFLLNCGITELLEQTEDIEQQWQSSQQLKKLLLPSEMGELFKVIALTKRLEMSLLGFKNFERTSKNS